MNQHAESGGTVALTNDERYALYLAGDHHPELCDCAGDDWSADGEWCGGLEDTFAAVERIIAARQAEVVRSLTASVEAAYPAERFPRAWAQGEDHRAGTVRTVLDMLRDCAERVTRPGQADPS